MPRCCSREQRLGHTSNAHWWCHVVLLQRPRPFLFSSCSKISRLEIDIKYLSAQKRELLQTIRNAQNNRKLFCKAGRYYKQWRSQAPELDIVERFIKKLPSDTPKLALDATTHPRNFPGEIRELALEHFIRNGRICRGVPALGRKAHKVTKERIEFDHILPDAKGGSRSELNIQVLCEECNRLKRAHAL